MVDGSEPVVQKETKMGKRTLIASVAVIVGVLAVAYALLFHPSCAKRNTYVPELNGCVLQRVTCKGLICSPQPDQNLTCGERANVCGAKVTCGCTEEDTTDWE